jgi:hypothetical protein
MKFSKLLLEYLRLRDDENDDTDDEPFMRGIARRARMEELLIEMDNFLEQK